LARAIHAMLEALSELSGSNAADHLPHQPAEFFNLLGMAEWAEISERYRTTQVLPWA